MTVRVMEGHVLDVLRSIPSNTFQCVATSPPYYGLRDYGLPPQVWGGEQHEHEWAYATRPGQSGGTASPKVQIKGADNFQIVAESQHAFCACGAWLGSLGLEPTPEMYVEHLVSVFREVQRVLRPDGVCWVNLGDSYAGSGKGPSNGLQTGASQLGRRNAGQFANGQAPTEWLPVPSGCKPKDLLGMPWMVAFALRADGWYLRSEIIWSKPNPMPESVTDRPTKAHETVFLLSKSRTYFYDAEAIREKAEYGFSEISGNFAGSIGGMHGVRTVTPGTGGTRNKRSVWEIATAPFPNAHFATFPPKLVEPMLLAGTSEKGCCPECGKPWERVAVAKTHQTWHNHENDLGNGQRQESNEFKGANYYANYTAPETTGWRPTCAHDAAPVPCRVLDPFGGAGTTGLVADRLGRDCTLIELNPGYASMARERIASDAPLFVDVA